MGVGKSTIGKILAKKLNYNFVDVDKLIEAKEGSSINLIFKNKSESYFRKIESDITLSNLKMKKSVISLGGGAFVNNIIRKSAKKLSISFWLDVSIDELVKRLKKSKKRPLLFEKNITETVKKIYFERKKISQTFTKKNTRINLSFLHDRNVSFTRNVIPFNFTYAFSKNRFSFGITPLRISVNQAIINPDFLSTLDNSGQFYTSQLLTNNIIAGPKATIHWNNKTSKSRSYWQIKSNALELSGNLTSLYFDLFTNETGKNREIFGVKYSQYARSDVDLSYTFIWDENNSLAYRFNTGIGLPYGNTEFLPFERRFFVGGGNSLRAWRPRTIGPGGYRDSSNAITIEKTGEVLLQASAEYRFDIIDKLIDGAVFVDAGNIWNYSKDENFPDGEFRFNRFYKELALNSGVGIRFDFSYVVFRVDWGISLHDPSLVEDERWIIKYFSRNRWIFDHSAVNFAIGFPF